MQSTDEGKDQPSPVCPAADPLGHLFPRPDGPRQSAEWAKRERDRRAGRYRKDWFKQK